MLNGIPAMDPLFIFLELDHIPPPLETLILYNLINHIEFIKGPVLINIGNQGIIKNLFV
jgi:hypothetical protein